MHHVFSVHAHVNRHYGIELKKEVHWNENRQNNSKNVLLLTEPVSFYNFQIKSSLYSNKVCM
jgi:hypothetical protein